MGEREHWPSLDGLRGVAILLVVMAHAALLIGPVGFQVGVTLFFVLSGFLITHVLLADEKALGRVSLARFYARRARRLLPALVVFLVVSGLIMSSLVPGFPIGNATWPALLYVSNYAQLLGVNMYTNPHTWSLAVEEHFYLVWPLAMVWVPAARRIRPLAVVVLGLIAWRLVVGQWDPLWAYQSSDANAYALGLGCLLGIMRHRGLEWRPPDRLGELSVAMLVLLGYWPIRSYASGGYDDLAGTGVWLPVVAALLSAVSVWACAHGRNPVLESPVLRFFGLVSYAWYLWHAPLLFYWATNRTVGGRILIVLGSLAVAWASWRFVERPLLPRRGRAPLRVPSVGGKLLPRPVTSSEAASP